MDHISQGLYSCYTNVHPSSRSFPVFHCILKVINYWSSDELIVKLFVPTSTGGGAQDVHCLLELVEGILYGKLVAVEPLTKL